MSTLKRIDDMAEWQNISGMCGFVCLFCFYRSASQCYELYNTFLSASFEVMHAVIMLLRPT
jgi:hypothetical protein